MKGHIEYVPLSVALGLTAETSPLPNGQRGARCRLHRFPIVSLLLFFLLACAFGWKCEDPPFPQEDDRHGAVSPLHSTSHPWSGNYSSPPVSGGFFQGVTG